MPQSHDIVSPPCGPHWQRLHVRFPGSICSGTTKPERLVEAAASMAEPLMCHMVGVTGATGNGETIAETT